MTDLAIVIPAYKAAFLDATLTSIAGQTDKNFAVYVGDDNSPEDLDSIIKKFKNELDISYVKFDNNLGATELTRQWDRCIALTGNEKWVWLFSDDDLMEQNCVSKFREALTETKSQHDLYRFNTKVIDAEGSIAYSNIVHPQTETSYQFAIDKLQLKRGSYVVEYIFSKQRYLESGKFICFPIAWCSDDATWVNIGSANDIYTIAGAFVHWRYSSANLSSSLGLVAEKLEASIQYIVWLKKWMYKNGPDDIDQVALFERSKHHWLQHQVRLLSKWFGPFESYKWSMAFSKRLSIPFFTSVLFFARQSFNNIKLELKNKLRPYLKSKSLDGY